MLHFGGVLWSQVEHAAAASGMSRLHRGTERAAGVTAGVDEACACGSEELALAAAGGVVDRGREVDRRTEDLMRLLAALRHKDPASAANDPH